MISKLTPAQEAEIPKYREKYLNIGLSTEPCDHNKAEAAITAGYKYLKLPTPEFIWKSNPFAGAITATCLATGKLEKSITAAELKNIISGASYGSFEAYWVAFYNFISENLAVKHDELSQIVKDIVQNCGVYWAFKDVAVLVEKPIEIHMKDQKAHNENGYFLKYADGYGVICINGVRYDSAVDATIQVLAAK